MVPGSTSDWLLRLNRMPRAADSCSPEVRFEFFRKNVTAHKKHPDLRHRSKGLSVSTLLRALKREHPLALSTSCYGTADKTLHYDRRQAF